MAAIEVGSSTAAEELGRKWVVALLGLLGAALVIAQVAAAPNKGFADGAAVLTMISLVAVGIERMVEMFWSLITTFKGAWWPLGQIADTIDSLVTDTNKTVEPAFAATLAALTAAKELAAAGGDELKKLNDDIRKVTEQKAAYAAQVQRIGTLAKDNQRVQLLSTAAFQAVNRLDTAYGDTYDSVRAAFNDVSQVATAASDILAGFKDNPAKKLISLALGSLIGLFVAGFIGLDLFAAAGAPLTVGGWKISDNFVLFPSIGVALTGLVLGLGANPTHEVIKFVSESAKSRRSANLSRPDVTAGPEGVPVSGDRESEVERLPAASPRAAGGARAPRGRRSPGVATGIALVPKAAMLRVRPGSMNLRS